MGSRSGIRRTVKRVPAPVYRFRAALIEGVIVSRPNRFVMIVNIGGVEVRCHCPTTGRIGELRLSGLPCLCSESDRPGRKTRYTVEAISGGGSPPSWIGINQTEANRYLEFFLKAGALSGIATGDVRREVRLGRSRIDFQVGKTFIEAKTPLITLPVGEGGGRVRHGKFDSFDRLIRHMGELRRSLGSGRRACIVLCYLYDAKPFRPPAPDGTNGRILEAARRAEQAGVERWQVNMKVDRERVSLLRYFRSRPYAQREGRARP